MQDHWKREEPEAEALAARWGFAEELRARREERDLIVLPRIDETEGRIVASITRRAVRRR